MAQEGMRSAPAAAVAPAGFGVRLGAYLIDIVIMLGPTGLIEFAFGVPLGWLLGTLVNALYYIYFWSNHAATPGKMALGLRVVSAADGRMIDPATAILRYVGYIVSGIPLCLGFLWVIWDGNKQGWHDKIAKTAVVRIR
jgi:uncharacterized RDD family membrane protein YckC